MENTDNIFTQNNKRSFKFYLDDKWSSRSPRKDFRRLALYPLILMLFLVSLFSAIDYEKILNEPIPLIVFLSYLLALFSLHLWMYNNLAESLMIDDRKISILKDSWVEVHWIDIKLAKVTFYRLWFFVTVRFKPAVKGLKSPHSYFFLTYFRMGKKEMDQFYAALDEIARKTDLKCNIKYRKNYK